MPIFRKGSNSSMTRPRNIANDEQGVSIVFACLVLTVLLVIGGIVIAYGYSNYNRAVKNFGGTSDYECVMQATRTVRDNIETANWANNLLTKGTATVELTADGADPATINVTCEKSAASDTLYTVSCSQGTESGTTLCFDCTLKDGTLTPRTDGIRKAGQ